MWGGTFSSVHQSWCKTLGQRVLESEMVTHTWGLHSFLGLGLPLCPPQGPDWSLLHAGELAFPLGRQTFPETVIPLKDCHHPFRVRHGGAGGRWDSWEDILVLLRAHLSGLSPKSTSWKLYWKELAQNGTLTEAGAPCEAKLSRSACSERLSLRHGALRTVRGGVSARALADNPCLLVHEARSLGGP